LARSAGGGDEALKEAVSLWSADLVEVCAALERVTGSDASPVRRYSPKCVERLSNKSLEGILMVRFQ
jgi:hypothetical protein